MILALANSVHTAIIGAGITGITCASVLQGQGLTGTGKEVLVFDKGRGLGGRIATRRVEAWQWDHGAQAFPSSQSTFQGVLNDLADWEAAPGQSLHVAQPTLNQLVKNLATGLNVSLDTKIENLQRTDGKWLLDTQTTSTQCDQLILAIPAAQALGLLEPVAGKLTEHLSGVRAVTMTPCWAVLVATRETLDISNCIKQPNANISLVTANHSKPGRPNHCGQYVIHMNTPWSIQHLEDRPTDIVEQVIPEFEACFGSMTIDYAVAHRWRFAETDRALGQPFVWDDSLQVGLCGDWCLGPLAEHGYHSGLALGTYLASLV